MSDTTTPENPTDIDTLTGLAKVLVDAANDTENAFATKGKSSASFLQLIPDIINVAGKLQEVPTEAKHLSEADLGSLVDTLKEGLKLPEGHAKEIGDGAFAFIKSLLPVLGAGKALSDAIAEKKDHASA